MEIIITFGMMLIFATLLYLYMKRKKIVKANFDIISKKMVVTYNNKKIEVFQQSEHGNLWIHYPMMKQVSSPALHSKLKEVYDYIKEHGNNYPTSHLS